MSFHISFHMRGLLAQRICPAAFGTPQEPTTPQPTHLSSLSLLLLRMSALSCGADARRPSTSESWLCAALSTASLLCSLSGCSVFSALPFTLSHVSCLLAARHCKFHQHPLS
jgi:hypothetical protein